MKRLIELRIFNGINDAPRGFKKITKEVNEIEALVNETNSLNVDEKKDNITRKLKKIK